ncbi:hypothetical protein AALP_AAs65627U000100, partial [Arabis alpina]
MADLGEDHGAVGTGAKSRRIERKPPSKEKVLGSNDFSLKQLKRQALYRYPTLVLDSNHHQLLIHYGSAMELLETRRNKSIQPFSDINPGVINDLQWSPLDLGEDHGAVGTGAKSRRIDRKRPSKKKKVLGSNDFSLKQLNRQALYRHPRVPLLPNYNHHQLLIRYGSAMELLEIR